MWIVCVCLQVYASPCQSHLTVYICIEDTSSPATLAEAHADKQCSAMSKKKIITVLYYMCIIM